MISTRDTELLFIEPKLPKTDRPIIDELTKKMVAAYHKTVNGFLIDGKIEDIATLGWQTCVCGAKSDNVNHVLPDKSMQTNSLCIHYLAWHRQEIPESEIRKVAQLKYGEATPSAEELQ